MPDSKEPQPPRNWPQNHPSGLDDVSRRYRREGDKAADFVVTENFEQFNQIDDVFRRSQWDDSIRTENSEQFYRSHVLPKPRKGDGFTQRDFAFRNASWTLANIFSDRGEEEGRREGFLDPLDPYFPKAEQKIEVEDPTRIAREIKNICKFFGAHIVGITNIDKRWHYQYRYDLKNQGDRPNDLPGGLTNVIVIGHAMDYDLVQTYPSALAGASCGSGYSHEAASVVQISQYIRNLGYEAVSSMNDTALAVPYAIKAGLGEYGRNQLVITPEFGPRVRFSKIFTDLPMALDQPKKFGITEFCNICERCADACPPKAIPRGQPTEFGPNKSSIRGVVKWTADCEKCFGYWARMGSDCAICMRVCPFNKDFSKWYYRLARNLAGTRLRKLILVLDSRLKLNKRVKPSGWWGKQGD